MTRRVLMICPDTQMIDRRVLQSARSLTQAGFEVDLVSGMECANEEHYELDEVAVHRFAFDWHDPRMDWLSRLPRIADASVRRLHEWHQLRGQHLRRFTTFDHFVLCMLERFDPSLVYVHDLPFLEYGFILARRHRVPLVFDTHEIYYEQETLPESSRARLEATEAKRIRAVDLFITVNDHIAQWYSNRYPGVQPLTLHNSLPSFDPVDRAVARRELLSRTGWAERDVIVMYQGWISAERNLACMIRSLDHVSDDVRLVVVGYGDHVHELEAIAQGLRRPDSVRFLGRLEQDELLRLTPGADIGVIPYLPVDLNHRLCSPNKFFEFVQNGVPVIAHELPFFVGMQQRLGVVETADLSSPQSFGAALDALAQRSDRLAELRTACGLRGPELVWENEYDGIARRCRELVHSSR